MSYLTSLQLEREPFSISPDPLFLYRSTEHYTALNRLEIAIRLKRGLSIILGDVGTGKTTLSRALLQAFNDDPEYLFHIILDPSFKTEEEFMTHVARMFGVYMHGTSLSECREAVEKYLYHKTVEENKTVVLLIDEGQKLSFSQLEILRTLLNYETNEFKMLQLIIFGQLELMAKIERMRNFMDRISNKFLLKPLEEYDVGQLIEFRLRQAGYRHEKSLFSRDAVHKIFEQTRGYPRQVGLLCQKVMEIFIVSDETSVTGHMVDTVIARDKNWN